MKSRRTAFRFKTLRLPIKYRTAYEDGQAILLDISTSGCTFTSLSLPLAVCEKFLISIDLEDREQPMEAQAVVVRSTGDGVAAKFTRIEPATKIRLRVFFSNLMRNELNKQEVLEK